MPKYLMPAVWALLILTLPVQAERAADVATQALIKELGLRASEVAIRETPAWKKPERIAVLLLEGMIAEPEGALQALEQVSDGVELVPVRRTADVMEAVADADALLGFCAPALLEAGKKLRWVQTYSAGVDTCVGTATLKERHILLTNMQRVHGPAIAEHVLAMLLSLANDLPRFQGLQRESKWERPLRGNSVAMEIKGKTMLVVGLGGIGTEIAKRANALGMRVIATRKSSREGPDFVDYVGLSNELSTLAKQADVVVNATPLTPGTTGLFDAKFFKAMQDSAYFINIGRGKSVVTADLIAALKRGDIAAAALDVTDPEPLPSDSELWTMPNVLITPHISAHSDASLQRVWLLVRENLRRYVSGEAMLNVVNVERGY